MLAEAFLWLKFLTWISAQYGLVLPEAAQMLALAAPSQPNINPVHLLQGPLTAQTGLGQSLLLVLSDIDWECPSKSSPV